MNIDKIEVMENGKNFIILPKIKKVLINDITKDIDEERIKDFIRIIRTWKSEYYSPGIDGNKFEINVYYDGKIDTIRGNRGVPNNYEEFSDFIRSIYDNR